MAQVMVMVAVTWIVPSLVFFITIFGWQYFVGRRTVEVGMCYVQYMEDALFNCFLQVYTRPPTCTFSVYPVCHYLVILISIVLMVASVDGHLPFLAACRCS